MLLLEQISAPLHPRTRTNQSEGKEQIRQKKGRYEFANHSIGLDDKAKKTTTKAKTNDKPKAVY